MTNEDLRRFYHDNPNIAHPGDFVRLNESGKVPASQLPSYVDDVIEGYYYNSKFYEDQNHSKEIKGEKGKIYVDLSTDNSYRWSGTKYTLISSPDMSMYIKKVLVSNITAIDSDILTELNCGDMVIKNESGNQHTYIVSYKQEEQGICMTYTDASVVETVSYDWVDTEWVYNSTDITPIIHSES